MITLSLFVMLFAPPPGDVDVRAAARIHFDRGVVAFRDRRFAEAAEEFKTAYDLSPAFIVLYNIGQVDVALGRPVEAVAAFRKYLDDGADRVPAQRRLEVEGELRRQQARIGQVRVRSRRPGAEVRIDGLLVGKTPLPAPVPLSVGHHTVEGALPAHPPALREIEVMGRTESELILEFAEPNPAPPSMSTATSAHVPRSPVITTGPVSAATAPRRSDSSGPPRILAFSLLGAGLAAGAVGATLAGVGTHEANDASAKYLGDPKGQLPRYNQGQKELRIGLITAGVGAAAFIAGGILYFFPTGRRDDRVALGIISGPAGLRAAALATRF